MYFFFLINVYTEKNRERRVKNKTILCFSPPFSGAILLFFSLQSILHTLFNIFSSFPPLFFSFVRYFCTGVPLGRERLHVNNQRIVIYYLYSFELRDRYSHFTFNCSLRIFLQNHDTCV